MSGGIGPIQPWLPANLRSVLGLGSDFRAALLATPGIQRLWMLGEAAGTVLVEEVAANHGTYTTAPTLGVAGPFVGRPERTAVTFAAASSQYASVMFPDLGGDFTYLALVKTASAALRLVLDVRNLVSEEIWMGMQAGGSGPAGLSVNGATTSSGPNLADSAWHLLGGTQIGTTVVVTVDGVAGTPQTAPARAGGPTSDLEISKHSTADYYWNGQIAAVAYLSRGLSAAEQLALWKIARAL